MDSKITWIDKLCVCKVLFFFIWLAIYRNIFLLFLSFGMSLKYCNYGFFFKFVIYCFLSLLLVLEHQPLKSSGVYFRCRLIIVQPKAIFLYVLNVCFFLQWLFTILGYCVHILMTSSFSVESITKKCLLELPYHQMLCITPASFCW